MDFVNIAGEVERAVNESGVRKGLCLVNAMHITVSIFINDDEPGLHEDYTRSLEWLTPHDPAPSGIITIALVRTTATRIISVR